MRISPIAFNYGIKQNVQNQKAASNPVSFGGGHERYIDIMDDPPEEIAESERFSELHESLTPHEGDFSGDYFANAVHFSKIGCANINKSQNAGEGADARFKNELLSFINTSLEDISTGGTDSLKDDRNKAAIRAQKLYEYGKKLAEKSLPEETLKELELELLNAEGFVERLPAPHGKTEEDLTEDYQDYTVVPVVVEDIKVERLDGTLEREYTIVKNKGDDKLRWIKLKTYGADGTTLVSKEDKDYTSPFCKGRYMDNYKIKWYTAEQRFNPEVEMEIRFFEDGSPFSIEIGSNFKDGYTKELAQYDYYDTHDNTEEPKETYSDDVWKGFGNICETICHNKNRGAKSETTYRSTRLLGDKSESNTPFSQRQIYDEGGVLLKEFKE